MPVPLNCMSGVFAGVVLSRQPSSTGLLQGGAGLIPAPGVGVTMTSLNLSNTRIAQRGVIRAGDSYSIAPVRFGNPVQPGTMCSAVSDLSGFFCVPFTGLDGSLALGKTQQPRACLFESEFNGVFSISARDSTRFADSKLFLEVDLCRMGMGNYCTRSNS